MSRLNRFDVYIGILYDTDDLIKRAENQYKFEKDLTDFLNTNIYSKYKKWVFGTDRQISQHCKHKIDTIFRLQNKITDLQSQLAEKKKEINDWKQRFNSSEERCKTFLTNGAKALELKNQDKISFAVEQLEKVKEFVNDFYGEYSASVTTNFIDNQIASLKKEMK